MEKNEAKASAGDDLGIVDGSEVVLQCSKEFVFPDEMWVGD